MKTILILFAALSFISCSKNDDTASVDPIYGNWIYKIPSASSNGVKFYSANIDSNGSIKIMKVYAYGSSESMTLYYRQQIGTFVRNRDEFKITYNYETCDPTKEETLYIKEVNGQLLVDVRHQNVQLIFAKPPPAESNTYTAALVEDKNCDILAKIQKKSGRLPASVKPKSFFDGLIK